MLVVGKYLIEHAQQVTKQVKLCSIQFKRIGGDVDEAKVKVTLGLGLTPHTGIPGLVLMACILKL